MLQYVPSYMTADCLTVTENWLNDTVTVDEMPLKASRYIDVIGMLI